MKFRVPVILGLCILTGVMGLYAQDTSRRTRTLVINKPKADARLIDQVGNLTGEDRSARFDNLFTEISNNPGSIAYVVLFCGRKCQYGEIEAHIRGIEVKIGLRKVDRSKLVLVNGGFREKFDTELWLVENSSATPEIKPTVNIRYVTFAGTTRRTLEYYDCCDDYRPFWENLKP